MDCYQQRDRELTNLLNIMTQATDRDIAEIKDLITAGNVATQKQIDTITKATEANTKAISDLTLEMRVGFEKIEGKLDGNNGRLVAVEGNLKGLDARLWGFGGTLLGAVLAALLAIFGRFLFANTPLG